VITDQQLRTMSRRELEALRRRTLSELVRRDREGEPEITYTPARAVRESQVIEARPYADGRLLLERRAYTRKDGSTLWRGPYWYFHHHEHGKQRKRYVGKAEKIDDPCVALAEKRDKEGW
jgi:hypothetical protein